MKRNLHLLDDHPVLEDPHTYYRADIDGLRAIAVILVLIFHARIYPSLSGGFVGVDVFFVISGFLIASIIRREIRAQAFSVARFYERRIRRIFPALVVVVLATLAVGSVLFPPEQMHALARSSVSALGFYSNLDSLAQAGYFQPEVDTLPLLHVWSLGIEEQFYLIVPAILLFLSKVPRYERSAVLGVAGLSFAYANWLVSRDPDMAFYLPMARAWELLVGVLLAFGIRPIASRWLREAVSASGLALIVGSGFCLTPSIPFPGLTALPACLGTALVIYAGAHGTTGTSRLLSCSPVWFVGQISYSLYLWHWPILAFARYHMWGEPGWWGRFALLVSAFVLSVLSWRFIELPIRRPRKELAQRWVFAGATLAMFFVVCFFTASRLTRGFEFRYPEIEMLRAAESDPIDPTVQCDQRPGPEPSALCEIGGTTPAFLVWGDSHAHSLDAGFAEVAHLTGKQMFLSYQHECPPLLGLNVGTTRDTINCAVVNDDALRLVRERDIGHVFLVGRWDGYANDGDHDHSDLLPGFRPNVFVNQGLANSVAFAKLLPATVAAIRDSGARVTLVAVVPEAGFDVPTAVIRMRISGAKPPLQTVSTYRERQAGVMTVLESLVEDRVDVFYPDRVLCSQGECAIEEGGIPLYFDNHHLSPIGARKLAPALAGVLTADLPDR